MSAPDKEQHSENEYTGLWCWRKLKQGYVITSGGLIDPPCRTSNLIDNRKYSVLSFVPVILYHQFSFFFNLYFLFLCVTQFVPEFKVGFTITYVGPLIFVLTLTMAKEAWDEYKQYVRDKALNSAAFSKVGKDGTLRPVLSKNIKVGDVLYLEKGDRVPADLVVLATKNDSGVIYLKTDQLDGETDWKLRESIKCVQARVSSGVSVQEVKYQVEVLRPTNKIYEFRGTAQVDDDPNPEGLRLEHTAWASTTVAAGEFYGLVIYVGKDTRIQMNGSDARVKFPKCDFEINTISKFLFGFCLACSLFLVALKGFKGQWVVQWIQFLVLLCCLIPQSLRTNLDVVKLIYAYRINKDRDIPGTICKNSQITEDLGRVSFLLSDKTGTLTQNNMLFRKLSTGSVQYTEEDLSEIKKVAKEARFGTEGVGSKRQQELAMLLHSLLLCHSVQPCVDSAGGRFLQSASPDEIALVDFCETLGWKLESRDRTTMEVITPSGSSFKVEILECFPFSSARKRMGILLKVREDDSPLLYMLKGADTVVATKVEKKGDILLEEADNLAREGLRTLAFAYKWVSQTQYTNWKDKMTKVKGSLDATEDDEEKVISELEGGLTLAGVSGVEDLLQEQVRDTIESLRDGGIRVWVLTGDKVETAKCIAKATGLKQKQENFFEMLDEDPVKIENQIYQLATKRDVLVIQGTTLACIYESGLELNFFNNVQHLHAVMFCRCSPTQKAQIVRSVQKVTGAVVAAIGDGGNDVSMIQQAEVGVGIEGKEGLQAAMSADFSLLKFKYVKDLLFWHGRRATLSTAYVTLFVIHRGLIIALIQFCFSLFFYFVAVSFYNAYLILAYSLVYLVLPVIVLASASDVTRYHALNYPRLYFISQQSRLLSLVHFLGVFWKSMYQAVVIFLGGHFLVPNSFLTLVTVTFSALVFTELLNICTLVDRLNRWIIGANLISLLFYLLSLVLLKEALGLQTVTSDMLMKIMLIVCISWVPFELCRTGTKILCPSISDKIMMSIRKPARSPAQDVQIEQAAGDLELVHQNIRSGSNTIF